MPTYFKITASPKHHERQLYDFSRSDRRRESHCDGEHQSYADRQDTERDLPDAIRKWGDTADLANIRIDEINFSPDNDYSSKGRHKPCRPRESAQRE